MKKVLPLLCFVLIVNILTAQVSKSMFENRFENEKTSDALRHEDEVRQKLPFFNANKPPISTKKAVKSVQTFLFKQVNIAAGGLSSALTTTEKSTVTNLTITGTIDARDFKTMRDSMTVLSLIDISNTTIAAYNGSGGTGYNTIYPANEIPEFAFFMNSNQGGSFNTKLTSIQLPSSITSIGSTAFALCSALNSIYIPSTVQTLGQTVFTGSNCTITVDANNTKFASMDGVLFDKLMTTLIQCPTSKTGSYSIPSTVSSIGLGAFYTCSTLTSLIIPSSVNSIEGMAFYNCTGLTSIYVYSSPISLSSTSSNNPVFMFVNFATCTLYVPYGAKALFATAPQWSDFTNVVESTQGFSIGATSAKLAAAANSNTTIDVKANVFWIANSDQWWLNVSPGSGYNNGTLTLTAQANTADILRTAKVTVSSSGYASQTILVTQGVVTKTFSVTAGGLSKVLTSTGLSTYSNLILTGTIDARDFKVMRDSMPSLSDLDLSGVSIAAYTGTAGTYGTSSTTYPANEIPQYAFYTSNSNTGKASLTTLILPSTITSIGYGAFENCTGLTGNLIIPSSVTSIGSNAFYGCTALTGFTVSGSNTNYSSVDGVLFDKNITSLIRCPQAKQGSYTLPNSVISIGDQAFDGCSGLTNIILGNSLKTIGNSAFQSCIKLTTITIPNAVTTIGSYAFNACFALTEFIVQSANQNYSSVDGVLFNKNASILIQCPGAKTGSYIIPATVTSIGSSAFSNCKSLTSVTIPSSVNTIGSYAFQGCSGLTSIYVNSFPIVLTSSYVFSGLNTSACTLYVPYGTKTLYQAANQWSSFTIIVETQGFIVGSNTAKILNVVGSTTTVEIKANVFWTASSDQSWLTVSPGSGSGNGILTLTSVSQSQTLRTATVTVSSPGYASQTIAVTETNGMTYCTAGSTATSYEYISNVAIGSINQASGRGTAGYEDYTSKITTMQKGVNTSATITVANSYSSDQVIIWIDWNQDGVFDEVTEKVYASTGTSFTSPHTSANFAPPAGAKTGITRMRIRLNYAGSGSNITSCGTSSYGEVEDYSVNVVNATAVPTVSDGASIQIVPNPVMDAFKIDGFEGSAKLTLLDLNGRLLLQQQLNTNEIVNISSLTKGMYIVKLITESGTFEQKMLKK